MQFTYSKGLIWCFPLCLVLLSCCQPLFPSLPLLVKALWSGRGWMEWVELKRQNYGVTMISWCIWFVVWFGWKNGKVVCMEWINKLVKTIVWSVSFCVQWDSWMLFVWRCQNGSFQSCGLFSYRTQLKKTSHHLEIGIIQPFSWKKLRLNLNWL